MDDLRREVNKAFDQGQAQLGDLEGARERMIHRALAARTAEPGNHMQLAAGLAAILIAALVIATFAYIRAGSQPSPAGRINVPVSTPMILFHDPANVGQIDGITWDGRSSVRIGEGGIDSGTSNPAGTMYTTVEGVRDRTGRVVGPMAYAWGNPYHVTWADDERHYCQMVPAAPGPGSGPGMLQLVLPGSPASNVGEIGTWGPIGGNLPPPTVAACSVEGDRAVVSQMTVSGKLTIQLWVVQLSTGRVLWTHSTRLPGPTGGFRVVPTHDAQLVAVTTFSAGPAASTIYSSDGSVVTHLAADVDAFSWDGSLAVISPSSGGPVTLTRWRDSTVLWSGPVGFHFRDVRSEPGGGRVAIGLTDTNSADTATVRLVNLYVISADGQVIWHKDNVYLA